MRHRNLRAGRDSGIRRLSRLTWRATLLSVVTAFGMTTLFAKTAPSAVGTTSGPSTSAGTSAPQPSASGTSPSASPSASASRRPSRHSATLKTAAQPARTVQVPEGVLLDLGATAKALAADRAAAAIEWSAIVGHDVTAH